MLDHFIGNIFEGVNKQFCMGQKWKKPIIKHGKMTKYNYIVQYPDNLTLGKNFDIGEFTYVNCKNKVIIEDNVQ